MKDDLRMKLMKDKIIKNRQAGKLPSIPAVPKREDSAIPTTDKGKQ